MFKGISDDPRYQLLKQSLNLVEHSSAFKSANETIIE
jgi:hypothetical protein